MCSECRRTPCHPRCPNANEPPVVCKCDICGDGIYDGDAFYVIGELNVCEDCVDNSKTYAEIDD